MKLLIKIIGSNKLGFVEDYQNNSAIVLTKDGLEIIRISQIEPLRYVEYPSINDLNGTEIL